MDHRHRCRDTFCTDRPPDRKKSLCISSEKKKRITKHLKRIIATILLTLFFSILNLSSVLAEKDFIAELHEPADPDIIAPEDLDEARFQAWTAYMEAELSDDQLLEETEE